MRRTNLQIQIVELLLDSQCSISWLGIHGDIRSRAGLVGKIRRRRNVLNDICVPAVKRPPLNS